MTNNIGTFANEQGKMNQFVNFDKSMVNILKEDFRQLFKESFKLTKKRRSQSAMITSRIGKMTIGSLYKSKKLKKVNYFHASYENDLPRFLKEEVNQLVMKVQEKGKLLKRIPSVDLMPMDREKEEQIRDKQVHVLSRIKSYFDNAAQKIEQTQANMRSGDSKFDSHMPTPGKRSKMKRIVFKSKQQQDETSPSFNRLRRTNYSMHMAKQIVLSKKEMEKSLDKVRRNIKFITGVN